MIKIIFLEVKKVEERHNEVELQEEKILDPEPSAKTSEQPESPQNEKIETPNEPTDTNESETTKTATEAPIDEPVDKVDQSAAPIPPSSPQSTTVEINTPRRDLNPTQDIENEEIVIEGPPGNKPSPDGMSQDMVPKSLGIVVSPKYVVEKETASTPASTGENTLSPAKEANAESELKDEISTTLENNEENTVPPSEEANADSQLRNEADATPGDIKEAASPQVDADDTLPPQENAEPTHTAPEETSGIKDLKSSQASPHELTNVAPEDTTTSQETKEAIEDSVESRQPRDDTGNISVSDKKDSPLGETKMDETTEIQEGEEKHNENPTDSN